MSFFGVLGIVVGVLVLAGSAVAEPSIVTLANGTRLHGMIVEETPDSIRLVDPVLGELVVPRSGVVAVIRGGDGDAAVVPAEPVAEAEAEVEALEPDLSGRYGFLRGWSWEAEVGLSGSEGNTERFNLRTALRGQRESDQISTTIRLSYNYATTDGERSEDRFLARLRNDWKLGESRWRIFAEGEFEYDDFQDWDWRWSAFGGLGYAFIDNDRTLLLGRVGVGVNQFVGGENDDVTPEALLGLQFNHKFTERQSFESEATLFPDLDDSGEYRFVGRAAYSILVDPELNMSLRVGVENRYNSNPGGDSKRSDVDYFLALVWAF